MHNMGGTGLGLAVAKEIVTYHKGTVSLSRRPKGEGTKLEVIFPSLTTVTNLLQDSKWS